MAESIPMLYVKVRNSFDAGYQIGRTFKHSIDTYSHSAAFRELKEFYRSETGRRVYEESLSKTVESFPEIVGEIRGMAEGADREFEDIFLNCIVSDILLWHAGKKPSAANRQSGDTLNKQPAETANIQVDRANMQPTDTVTANIQPIDTANKQPTESVNDEMELAGCTDILVNTPTCRLVGHNEDWGDEVKNLFYLVDVEISNGDEENEGNASSNVIGTSVTEETSEQRLCVTEGDTAKNKTSDKRTWDQGTSEKRRIGRKMERFISCVFPAGLAGATFSMNYHFVFTVNSLVPIDGNRAGVPVDILLRALMGCTTIEQCVTLMQNHPGGCSYGININIASIETTDMWSLEVYTQEGSSSVDLHHIPCNDSNQQYIHCNHYIHTAHARESPRTVGSMERTKTARTFGTPRNVRDMGKILGDTSSNLEPIYRSVGASFYNKHVTTVASAIFHMDARLLHVYTNNPSIADTPTVTVPFIQHE